MIHNIHGHVTFSTDVNNKSILPEVRDAFKESQTT